MQQVRSDLELEPNSSPILRSCSFVGLRRAKRASEWAEEACGGPWREAGSCEMTKLVMASKQRC